MLRHGSVLRHVRTLLRMMHQCWNPLHCWRRPGGVPLVLTQDLFQPGRQFKQKGIVPTTWPINKGAAVGPSGISKKNNNKPPQDQQQHQMNGQAVTYEGADNMGVAGGSSAIESSETGSFQK